MEKDIRELALDTLHNRRLEASESCFISNAAGGELQKCGEESLSIIEELIRESVEPAMIEHAQNHGLVDPDAIFREGPPFAGLDYLLGSYWIICARVDPSRAVCFMNETAPSVLAESIYQLPVFFNSDRPLSDVAFPREYANYLSGLGGSEVEGIAKVAKYVIQKMSLIEIAES